MPKTAKQSIHARGDHAVIKLRSDIIAPHDLSLNLVWVHNGLYYAQMAPIDKDAVGLKYGMLVSCHRSPKHPVKNTRLATRTKK